MTTNIKRSRIARYSLLALAAALTLTAGAANAALASEATPAAQAPGPYVTIIPDTNPLYLPAGQTQGLDSVAIQTSGGPGFFSICANHGGADLPVTGTPAIPSHQQIPVFLGQPNIVMVFWSPASGPVTCGSPSQLVATFQLDVRASLHVFPCLACVSQLPDRLEALDR